MKARAISQGVKVNVKVVPHEHARPLQILSRTPGVKTVIPTFPDAPDQELASLYLLEVDPSSLDTALKLLRKDPHVEYAEVAAPRKLIR